ncbi:MAG: hypothetical protein IIX45_06285, partial [Lachnospiraceae bacterium]|nr:hypothetical protein [Lachnospiraceae bacterium]
MVSSVKNKFFTRKFVPAQGAKSTCKVCRCRKGMGINMKKKRISTVLFSIMCFCMLAGCADNEQEKVTDTQLEQQRGENFELEAGQEVLPGNENEEEQNQMQQTVQAPPQIAFETVNKNWWNADKSAVVVNANYQRITVEGEGYEALATSLGGFSSTQEETGQSETTPSETRPYMPESPAQPSNLRESGTSQNSEQNKPK